MPGNEDLTPWCTCFGSLVCSYYADKFKNDGTSIKFINEPGSNPPGAFSARILALSRTGRDENIHARRQCLNSHEV